ERKGRKAQPGRKAHWGRKAQPARKGVFDIGKSNFYKNFVLNNPADRFIPGTNIERLPVIPLGKWAVGASEEEVKRIVDELAALATQARDAKINAPIEQQTA